MHKSSVRHLLEVGQFGLLNLAHVPEQDFAHGIEGILPLKKFIERYKNVSAFKQLFISVSF